MGSKGNAKMKPEIELLDGEVLCDKCEGSGLDYSNGAYLCSCKKCQGKGKLDWVENARGGKRPLGTTTISFPLQNMESIFIMDPKLIKIGDSTLEDYIKNVVAKEMAEKIDKAILEELMKNS